MDKAMNQTLVDPLDNTNDDPTVQTELVLGVLIAPALGDLAGEAAALEILHCFRR